MTTQNQNNSKTYYVLALATILLSVQFLPMGSTFNSAVAQNVTPIPFGNDKSQTVPIPTLVPESKTPRPGIPIPANAIQTPDGGYVTIPRPFAEDGTKLNVKYESGPITSAKDGDVVPACRGPSSGLYQEGSVYWTTTSNANTIGYSENWKMPTGGISGSNVGIYFNPVNFKYPASGLNYNFFQATYGIGNNLSLGTGWKLVAVHPDGTGGNIYTAVSMTGVTVSPGSTYKVDAMLQPYPLANPSAYVVQVTLGSNAWVYSLPLGYTPSPGSINSFHTYNDQWLKSSGTTTLSTSSSTNPQVIKKSGSSFVFDASLVTGKNLQDILTPASGITTRDILTPTSTGTKSYNDVVECTSWS